ncbi:hypothetical protein GGR56DRAFT_365 [Xylariaceae sp. FL0804]|nr:hypothetical protein GGR56DRAFT_365 [Xylariaceae sp. FL0804]
MLIVESPPNDTASWMHVDQAGRPQKSTKVFVLGWTNGTSSFSSTRSGISTRRARCCLSCCTVLTDFTSISSSRSAFLIEAEIGGVKLRLKSATFGTACNILASVLLNRGSFAKWSCRHQTRSH